MGKRADGGYLREVAYADPAGFMDRVGLYDHQQPRIDIIAEALEDPRHPRNVLGLPVAA